MKPDWKPIRLIDYSKEFGPEKDPPCGVQVMWYSPTKGVSIGDRWSGSHFYSRGSNHSAFDVTHYADVPEGPGE
jgi:hypothetical protein